MWHWLHKNVLVADLCMRRCVIISASVHLFLILISLLLNYIRPAQQITIRKDLQVTKEVTIIIDPHAAVTGLVTQRTPHAKSDVAQPQKLQASAPAQPVIKPATTVVAETKKMASQLQKKTPSKSLKKKEQPKPKKKPSVKPKPAVKKTATPAKPENKALPKNIPEKIVAQKPAVETKTAEPAVPPAVNQAPSTPILAQIDGPIMIARSAADAAALTVQLEVQEALLQVWRPPVGVADTVSCLVGVTIDAAGKTQAIEIVKPSGMLLFDVSARAAVQQAQWPRGVWGMRLELCLQ